MSTTPYDIVTYAGLPQPEAHPDRLAALGRLFGLATAPVETCRVLELGCGDGVNIIPVAAALPRATFLGIDLSAAAIERGQATLTGLGWRHAALRQMDLMDVSAELGQFDYIVAHGVYSWVPAAVRDRIMEICQQHLSPGGVAYISYNVLPGCRLRQAGWELMRFHCAGMEAREQVAKAREILKLAADATAPESPYGAVLKAEAQRVSENPESLVFHDDLAAVTTPVHFHEFAAHAAAYGLQYICDASYKQDGDPQVSPRSAEFLKKVGETDLIRWEQYADFVVGRPFRRSLLCHTGAVLSRPVAPERLRGLRIASALRPTTAVSSASEAVAEFRHPQGKSISINLPLAKAALVCLGEAWPQSVPFEELVARAREKSGGKGNQEEETLGRFLLTALSTALVGVHSVAAPIVTTVSERPRASALARWQAQRGPMVTTLTCAMIHLEGELAARLLNLLDGRHDIRALCRELRVEKTVLLRKIGELAGAGMLEG